MVEAPGHILDRTLVKLLRAAHKNSASDLHIKAGGPPRLRVRGELRPLRMDDLTGDDTERMVRSTMRESEWDDFSHKWEKDYSIDLDGIGRFRVNAFYTRGSIGMILRRINAEPPSLEGLGVPEAIKSLAKEKNGLILVCGATGSGKSTTLAGIVNYINQERGVHIVTIEDPIEYIHNDIKASISQREVSSDTKDFGSALHSALRQDPDVILLGEMRQEETVRTALAAAETGHLVMTTLHTTSAPEAITRLLDFFPEGEQKQIRFALANSLRGIVCQRLVQSSDGTKRLAVVEMLVNQGRIPEAILSPEKYDVGDIMREGKGFGMQTFEDHLAALVVQDAITMETALESTVNKHDFNVRMRNLRSRRN